MCSTRGGNRPGGANSRPILFTPFAITVVSLVALFIFLNERRSSEHSDAILGITKPKEEKKSFPRESPSVPTPRTGWSTRNIEQLSMWMECQRKLRWEKEKWVGRQGLKLLLLGEKRAGTMYCDVVNSKPRSRVAGDSITEHLTGASVGVVSHRLDEVKAAFDSSFEDDTTLALGISGDQTQHLLWRLGEGGELEGLEPEFVHILIGETAPLRSLITSAFGCIYHSTSPPSSTVAIILTHHPNSLRSSSVNHCHQ